MKKVLCGLVTLVSLSSFASVEIAQIKERNSERSLIYSQEEVGSKQLIFTLVDGETKTVIKKLTVENNNDSLALAGDNDRYNFDFVRNMSKASAAAYEWCFTKEVCSKHVSDMSCVPATSGQLFFLVGSVVSGALCMTVPGIPFIVGVIASPIDGIITLGDHLTDADTIAARKFDRLLKGKDKVASKKVFNSLLEQISKL